MFKLKPLDGDAKEFPGVSLWEIISGQVKIDRTNPLILTKQLRKTHGQIFKVLIPGGSGLIFLASQKMVSAILSKDDTEKVMHNFLNELRNPPGMNGLFTSFNDEPEWEMAHRILMPAFGAISIHGMYNQMCDVLSSMIVKWSTIDGEVMDMPDQLTRLTLDTIGLCSFNYRFNSFYRDDMHPFIQDMIEFLSISANKALSPGTKLLRVDQTYFWYKALYRMEAFGNNILQQRKKGINSADDLCRRMLEVADPETGEKLPDKNVTAQLVTFLVAGHETTSGLLSFTLYYMCKNPETIKKAQAEVDAYGQLDKDCMNKLPYIDACLKEALRLQPTAPMFSVKSKTATDLGDGYKLPAGQEVMIDLHGLHTDPIVYPEPHKFKPERMMDGGFEKLPPHSWKPFGHGVRACIGRAFAIQESILALACIFQNYDIEFADPDYNLGIKFTLTIKPDNMKMKVRRRHAGPPIIPLSTDVRNASVNGPKQDKKPAVNGTVDDKPIRILFGSDAGSCEALAKELSDEAKGYGFDPTVKALDDGIELPKDQTVVIITASYDGKPTANARKFAENLRSSPDYAGIDYALFGCGHSDWVETYQHVPRSFESGMKKAGAKAIIARGEGNAAGDLHGQWEEWKDFLFSRLVNGDSEDATTLEKTKSGLNRHKSGLNRVRTNGSGVERTKSGSTATPANVKVIANKILVKATELGFEKRHLLVKADKANLYEVGDYMCVVPKNADSVIDRILKHFGKSREDKIEDESAYELLQKLEVSAPVSRRSLGSLSTAAKDKKDKAFILDLDGDDNVYLSKVLDSRLSLIDLLEKCPSCKISLDQYINSLHNIRSRQYSISSTPLDKEDHISLCYDVLKRKDDKALVTGGGVCSTYLSLRPEKEEFECTIRKSAFHLPKKSSTPIICFAAGTGIAPFRGFIHQRAIQIKNGEKVGTTILYYGCRNDEDYCYKDEFEQWAKESKGKIIVKKTFSRDAEKTNGLKYIHEQVLADKDDVLEQFQNGAALYTCGSASKLARSLKLTFQKMIDETKDSKKKEQFQELYDATSTSRYKVDIFG